jgi:GWxTD domain-containing protein
MAVLALYLGTASPGFSLPPGPQQETPSSTPPAPNASAKDKKKSERKLLKELDNTYRRWLEEDVLYIITPDERRAFLQLATNEEREQFIEAFWQRRNPDPDSPENTFKEEHYRRIAYANEHFASGLPGWKTDRGRVYITWGPPDEIDSHPNGGAYERTPEEGGGSTTAFPFEDWRYRHIDAIGDDVNLEFVDPTMTGEFHLTTDPCEKDALAHTATGGMTLSEGLGMSTRAQRYTNSDGTTCSPSLLMEPEGMQEFDRYFQYAKIMAAPPVKFKDLDALVTSKVLRNQVNFDYRFDFLRVTSDTVLVPITVQVPNKYLTFQSKEGVHSAVMNIYGRISTLTGRRVQVFEDTVNRDFAESLFRQSLSGKSIYQKAVPLRPGQYRLDLVIKDVNSGNTGVVSTALRVPRYEDEKLSTSTLILADQIERVSSQQIGLGQFVIGDSKVRPRLDQQFTNQERLGVYVQIYNLSVDEKTHKSDVVFDYGITRVEGPANAEILHRTESSAQLGQTGQQVTLEKLIPLSQLEPGKYKFTLLVTDNISKQTISPAAEFTVKAPAPAAAKNN